MEPKPTPKPSFHLNDMYNDHYVPRDSRSRKLYQDPKNILDEFANSKLRLRLSLANWWKEICDSVGVKFKWNLCHDFSDELHSTGQNGSTGLLCGGHKLNLSGLWWRVSCRIGSRQRWSDLSVKYWHHKVQCDNEPWKGPQEDSTPSCLSEMEAWFLFNKLVFPTLGEAVLFWGIQNLRDLQRCPVRIGRTLMRWRAKIAEGRFFFGVFFPYVIGSVFTADCGNGCFIEVHGILIKMTHILVFAMYFNSKHEDEKMWRAEKTWMNEPVHGYRRRKNAACASSGHLVTSAPPCSHVITHQWVATSEPKPSIHDLERQ